MSEEPTVAESNSFRVDADSDGGVTTLKLIGELDIAGTETFTAGVDEALGGKPQKLCIDVSELSFIDSSGIHALVRGVKEAQEQGIAFGVQGAQGEVRRLFEISGVDEFFETA